ncbi:hypothetical protein [Desulfobacula sp.]
MKPDNAHIDFKGVALLTILCASWGLNQVALGEGGIRDLTPAVTASLIYQIVWVAFITYVVWFWLIRK